MFGRGSNEIVVGKALRREFEGFDIGSTVSFGTSRWTVVGVFDAGGSVFESEIWADLPVVQSLFNRNNIVLCLELLKQGDSSFPVIVDAGVGSASDVSQAMELGADGVLLNTAVAHAKDPVMMAHAMRHATIGGRQSYLAGRIPKKLYATASSPWEGTISYIPGE